MEKSEAWPDVASVSGHAVSPDVEESSISDTSRAWWLFLVTGIAWFFVSLVVLRFQTESLVTVGILIGCLFVGAGLNEFLMASVRRSWRWIHALLGLFFLAGAAWAFVQPIDAFWALASVLGFLLVIKGSVDILSSALTRSLNPVWWLGLTVGMLEVLLAFWVSQQFFPARASLILVWVGFTAIFRGFSEIALAFQLRRFQ